MPGRFSELVDHLQPDVVPVQSILRVQFRQPLQFEGQRLLAERLDIAQYRAQAGRPALELPEYRAGSAVAGDLVEIETFVDFQNLSPPLS
jgi:hypothetical protein